MPINSVNQYTKGLLSGLQSPAYAPLVAYVTANIPTPDKFEQVLLGGVLRPQPAAYVWASTMHEDRQTMPRPLAWKKVTYRLQLILQVVEDPDDGERETAFPCLVDAIDMMLNTTTMPLVITDPVTGYPSQMLQIGEEQDTELFIPDAVSFGGQGFLRSAARMVLKVEESVNYPQGLVPPPGTGP